MSADGQIDTAQWRLAVDGLVHRPLSLDLGALLAMEQRIVTPRVQCIEGKEVGSSQWSGVPVDVLLDAAGPAADARYVEVRSGDYVTAFRLDSLARRGLVLGLRLGGVEIPGPRGGPVRLLFERGACFDLVKWVDGVRLAADGSASTTRALAAQRKRAVATGLASQTGAHTLPASGFS